MNLDRFVYAFVYGLLALLLGCCFAVDSLCGSLADDPDNLFDGCTGGRGGVA